MQPASPPRANDLTWPDRPDVPDAEPSYGVTSTATAFPVSPDSPAVLADPPSPACGRAVPAAATWVSPPRPPDAAAELSPVGPLVAVAAALPPEMTTDMLLPVRPEDAVAAAAPPAPPVTPAAGAERTLQSRPAEPFVAVAVASPVSPLRDSPSAPLPPELSDQALPLSPLLENALAAPPGPGVTPKTDVPGRDPEPGLTRLSALPVSPDRAVVAEAPRTVTATATEFPELPDRADEATLSPVASLRPGSTTAACGARAPASPERAADTAEPETATETAVAMPGVPTDDPLGIATLPTTGGSTVAWAPSPALRATARPQLGTVAVPSSTVQCRRSAPDDEPPASRSQLATSTVTEPRASARVLPSPASRSAT